MPPSIFPPFAGQMSNAPMQMMGGTGGNPLQAMAGMARNPMQMMAGMTGNPMQMAGRMAGGPMQALGRMSPLRSGMPMGTANAGGAGARGLLSRLFQRSGMNAAGNAANAATGFQRAAGGGSLLKGLANPGSINTFLNNTQNVLRTAQQIGPMVQQYGPLVRNLPSMWKMYRSLKNTSSDDDTDTASSESISDEKKESLQQKNNGNAGDEKGKAETSNEVPKKKKKKKKQIKSSEIKESKRVETPKVSNVTEGQSLPKLYV